MTTYDLIDKVAADHSLTKAVAKAVVDGVFKAISEAAVAGEDVGLPGFGKLKVPDRSAR